MKYSSKNKPIECMMTQSTCYKGTKKMTVKGVLWHSTGANNPNISRYVQPDDKASNKSALIKLIGKNKYGNDWNHISRQAGLNAWIGKLADGTVATVQTMPWNYRPWGCGSGSKGSCNDGWVQFEICEDGLSDKTYFNKVYKEACELTAYICDMYNLDPKGTTTVNGVKVPVILCHADAYKLKLGSNHGDVLYWFEKHGKTMTDVRNDVAALMKPATTTTTTTTTTTNKTATTATTTTGIKAGDVVSITSNAVYYSGKSVPSWVKKKNWIVDKVSGDRAIIDDSADGKESICSPINVKYLKVVGAKFKSYKVKVTTSALRIRSKPTTSGVQVGTIKDMGTYTIVDEEAGKGATMWGLLESGKEKRNKWISLDYVKKI